MAEQPRHHEPTPAERAAAREPGRPVEPVPPTGGEPPRRHEVHTEPAGTFFGRRISWGAIFAGVVVALAVQLLLSTLGLGIGAAILDPASPGDPGAWSIGAGVWWVITGLISLFVGGWVAGHLATNPDRRDGALHGLVTWGLATLVGVWLLTTTVGALTAGAWQVVATGVEGGALQTPATQQQPQQVDPQAQQPPQLEQEDIEEMVDPQQMAEEADTALAHAGIWTFLAMVLGALAAGFGGYLATPSNAPTEVQRR